MREATHTSACERAYATRLVHFEHSNVCTMRLPSLHQALNGSRLTPPPARARDSVLDPPQFLIAPLVSQDDAAGATKSSTGPRTHRLPYSLCGPLHSRTSAHRPFGIVYLHLRLEGCPPRIHCTVPELLRTPRRLCGRGDEGRLAPPPSNRARECSGAGTRACLTPYAHSLQGRASRHTNQSPVTYPPRAIGRLARASMPTLSTRRVLVTTLALLLVSAHALPLYSPSPSPRTQVVLQKRYGAKSTVMSIFGALLAFALILVTLLYYARAHDDTLDEPPPRRKFAATFLFRGSKRDEVELERFGLVTQSEFRRSAAYAEEQAKAKENMNRDAVGNLSLESGAVTVEREASRVRRWFGTWAKFHAYLG
ncbi:hypothetical protein EXIGLDRAFT_123358 [Exidia glandulosa HHB12029]|uniref:Uncharacterized protein n=1 Tax=Exidia glandulosa HHB12029 TaxID=1314781 RepID=A0A165NJQ8_EXIGL|nr:hypothetical protein EXIGLDRAFT_123358 [Exidia glandulosa HHB12029]